jgi:hypothetical protein
MNEDFVPFELAVKLKEKGFNYPCIGHYFNNQLYIAHYQNAFHSNNDESVDAPTISQVLKWLREKKNILVCVLPTGWNHAKECSLYYYVVYDTSNYYWKREVYQQSFETYKETELAGIEYVLDNWI